MVYIEAKGGQRMAKKLTYEEVKKAFEDRGYKLVSTEYVNSKSKLIYICGTHGEQEITYDSIKKGFGCLLCYKDLKSITYENVCREFSKVGYTVLQDDFSGNSKDKIACKCNACGYITSVCYNNVQQGKGCQVCRNKSTGDKRRVSYKEVKDAFKRNGYQLISTDYQNANTKLEYVCPNHGKRITTYHNLLAGMICSKCASDNNSGQLNSNWKGGITNLAANMRSKTSPWIRKALIESNYTCSITGLKGDVDVHHSYSFSNILQDTLLQLNMNIRQNVGDYSEEEFKLLSNTFIENNETMSKAIVIEKSLHNLFHVIYGRGNNSFSQFQEFKERYANGEFTEQLNIPA